MTNILARPRVIGSWKKRVRRQKSSTTLSSFATTPADFVAMPVFPFPIARTPG
jgi:hypothetical protein